MSYKAREYYSGGIYHITNRGNRRSDIFKDCEDFEYFMYLICDGIEHFGAENLKLIAYCLMDNHIHLLIKIKDMAPGEFMGRITGLYTRYFNKKNNYVGHLFGGRYHLEEVKNETGLLEVSRYIHLNPVRAVMVKFPQDYKWSSYSVFIGEEDEKFTSRDIVLRNFIYNYRFILYKEYVEKYMIKDVWEEE
ncbi:MAG: transposase [Clostridium sp.]